MDRNQPLIGGKLELEGAQAFARVAKQVEDSVTSLNKTLQLTGSSKATKGLTDIARAFDGIAKSSKGVASGLAAVNKQVDALSRRTKSIDKLSISIAKLNLANAAGLAAGNVRGATRVNTATINAALAAITAAQQLGGVGGGGSVRRPLASSALTLPRDEMRRRQQNAGIIKADIDSMKEVAAQEKKLLEQRQAENQKYWNKIRADQKAAQAKKQADTDTGFAWLAKREEEARRGEKARLDEAFKKQEVHNKQIIKDKQTTQDRLLADTQRVSKEERKRLESEAKARDKIRTKENAQIFRDSQERAKVMRNTFRETERISRARAAGGGRIGRGLTALGGAAAGGGRGGRPASSNRDVIPGIGLGSTAYLRANLGPTAIYSRMPLTLTSIGAAAVIATAAVTALGSQFAKTTNSLEVFSDATARQNKELINSTITLSRQYGSTADEIAASGVALAKAGAPVEDLKNNLLEYITVLTEVSQGELTATESATLVTQIITSMGLKWDQVGNIVDTTTGVIQNSAATFDDLAVFVQQLIPVGAAVGFTYDEMAITFGVLRNAGLGASVASTALKNSMLAMADPSSDAAKILDKYKISLFDAKGNALPLIDVITDLWKAFGEGAEGVTDAQQFFEMADIASTRQILAVSTLATQGPAAYAKLAAASRKSAQQMAMDLQNNPIKQLELLGNQIRANALLVSQGFMPSLTNILRTAQLSLGGTGEAYSELGRTINSVLTLQNQFARDLVNTLAPGMEASLRSVGRVFGDVGGQADTFGKLALGAAKLVSDALVELSKGIDRVRDGFKVAFGPALQADIQSTKQGIAEFSAFLQTVHDQLTTDRQIIDGWQESGAQKWNRLLAENLKSTRDAMGLIDETVDSARETFATSASKLGLAAEDATADMVKGIEYATGTLADASSHSTTLLIEVISDDITKLGFGTDNAVGTLIQGIDVSTGKLVDAVGVTMDLAGSRVTGFMDEISQRFADASAVAAANIMSAADFWAIAAKDPMSNSMGFWDLPGVLPPTIPRPVPRPTGIGRTQAPGGGGGGGSAPKGPDLDDLTAQVKSLLSDVPGLTDELFRFVAGLAQDVPARLMPMVNAIISSREEVGGLLVAKRGLMNIDFQLMVSARRMAVLQGQQGKLEIEQAIAVIGYDRQLLGLRQQVLEIDAQMAPIKERLLLIDREVARLQQENLVLARQRIQTELEMLPLQYQLEAIEKRINDLGKTDYEAAKQRLGLDLVMLPIRRQIEDIEKRVAEVNKKNFELTREKLNLELEALPITQKIRDLEEAITKTVDRRAGLQRELKELDLADVEDSLAAAWEKMDVPLILDLEKQKTALADQLKGDEKADRAIRRRQIGLELEKVALEESLEPLNKRLQAISDTEEKQRILNDLIILGLEQEIAALQALLAPHEDHALRLDREKELRELLNEITKIGLEAEKAAIESMLQPMQDKLDAINREISAEQLRNSLVITHLEEERRRLQEQLIPLEDQRRAIERIIAEVDLLRARAQLEFEERKIGIQAMILEEQLRQAELEATRAEQELLFAQLVQGFIDGLAGSQAFTIDEALEVAKRGKLWDDQVADLIEIGVEFSRITDAALKYKQQLDAIDKNITITITTIHRDVYESGTGNGAGGSGSSANEPAVTNQSMRASQSVGVTNITNNHEYNVAANYSRTQSPASISQDLRAVIMASRN